MFVKYTRFVQVLLGQDAARSSPCLRDTSSSQSSVVYACSRGRYTAVAIYINQLSDYTLSTSCLAGRRDRCSLLPSAIGLAEPNTNITRCCVRVTLRRPPSRLYHVRQAQRRLRPQRSFPSKFDCDARDVLVRRRVLVASARWSRGRSGKPLYCSRVRSRSTWYMHDADKIELDFGAGATDGGSLTPST